MSQTRYCKLSGRSLDQRLEDGNRLGEAVLGPQEFDQSRLPAFVEHLATMGVQQDLDRPRIVVQPSVQVLGDVLAGRAGLFLLRPDFLGGAGEVGLFLAPEVVVVLH